MTRAICVAAWMLGVLLLGGCQVTHTLHNPVIETEPQLPAINVQVGGSVPSHWVRNELRRVGVFESIGEGQSPHGYNVLVTTSANYRGLHNIPKLLLSALTLFTIPASVSWDGRMQFRVSRGEQVLAYYDIANQSRHLMGLFVNPNGPGDNAQVIVDEFVRRLQKDASIFRAPMIKPSYSPEPIAPTEPSSSVGDVTLSFTVHADGSVSDLQAAEGDRPELVKSVVDAVSKWRFEPWPVADGMPREQRVLKRFHFGTGQVGSSGASLNDYIAELMAQPCGAINDELAKFQKTHPQEPLKNMQSFKDASAALFLAGISVEKDPAKITRMSSKFNANLPWIIAQCQAKPGARFQDVVSGAMLR